MRIPPRFLFIAFAIGFVALLAASVLPSISRAQNINPLEQFTSTSSPATAITQRTWGKNLRLTGYSAGCAEFSANGTLTSTGSVCAGSSNTIGSTTPWSSGQLAWIVDNDTLSGVSTTTLSGNSQISISGTPIIIGASPLTLSIAGDSIGDSQLAFNTGQNLTTVSTPTFGGLTLTPLTSALLVTDGSGVLAEYAGTSCTNQFIRSLSALGAATCETVANTDLANSTISGISLGSNLADLTATNSTLTFSGAYNGGTARTVGINLAAGNVWTAASSTFVGGLTIVTATTTSATTTNFYVSGVSRMVSVIVTGISAAFTAASEGELGFDTTYNDFEFFSGGATRVIPSVQYRGFNYSTTTTWTGTTTDTGLWVTPRNLTVQTFWCKTDAGFIATQFGDGTNFTPYVVSSTTVGTTTPSSNNTFVQGEPLYFRFGTSTTATTKQIFCTLGYTYADS